MTDPADLAVVGGYALVLLAIGATVLEREESSEGFLLADRRLGTARVFAATFSTFYGTGIVFTFASFGFLYGVGAVSLPVVAVIGFLPLVWAAPRIKTLADRRNAITLPGLMVESWSAPTRGLGALLTAGLFTAALAVNLRVAGTALNVLLDVPLRAGVVAFGIVVVAYTAIGGFRSVVRTDVLQMVVIVASVLVVLPVVVLVEAGPDVVDGVPASHLDPLAIPVPIVLVYLLVGVFTFFGSQDIFQRIYAARSGRDARRGLLLFTVSLAIVGPVAVGLGIAGRAILPSVGADAVLFSLSGDVVPPELVVVVLLGYLALANSDADSQLLTVASTLTHDFLPYLDVDSGNNGQVWADRFAVLGVGAVAVSVAAGLPDLVALLGGLGTLFAILGVAVIATLYWDGATDRAVFAGLAIGTTVPAVFVAATGTVRVAPVLGVASVAVTIPFVSVLSRRADGPRLPPVR